MKRRRLTSLQRVRIFDAHHGVCHICEQKIHVGQTWELDHVTELWEAGGDVPENLKPAHTVCHAGKTGRAHTIRAKGNRVRAAHLGVKIRRHRWGYGRDEPFKKRLDGKVVRR